MESRTRDSHSSRGPSMSSPVGCYHDNVYRQINSPSLLADVRPRGVSRSRIYMHMTCQENATSRAQVPNMAYTHHWNSCHIVQLAVESPPTRPTPHAPNPYPPLPLPLLLPQPIYHRPWCASVFSWLQRNEMGLGSRFHLGRMSHPGAGAESTRRVTCQEMPPQEPNTAYTHHRNSCHIVRLAVESPPTRSISTSAPASTVCLSPSIPVVGAPACLVCSCGFVEKWNGSRV